MPATILPNVVPVKMIGSLVANPSVDETVILSLEAVVAVAVVPERLIEEIDFKNQLPLAATPVKGSSANIKYIHSGTYRLKCIQDVTPLDGYPETSIRETTFTVTDAIRQSINVDLTCP